MIQDLHSHTYYSFCGADNPEDVVAGAIDGGIELLGICDHNYGITNVRREVLRYPPEVFPNTAGLSLVRYFDHINLVREKYADRIRILCGVEVATVSGEGRERHSLPQDADVSFFDYCLLEHIDNPCSVLKGDLFSFAERARCPVGIAHTDLFAFVRERGEDAYAYFREMAARGMFWEMNVNYDSVHKYREHPYMLEFFENSEQQAIVRESGLRLSVGFDSHRISEYLPDRVADYCRRIGEMGIALAFEE